MKNGESKEVQAIASKLCLRRSSIGTLASHSKRHGPRTGEGSASRVSDRRVRSTTTCNIAESCSSKSRIANRAWRHRRRPRAEFGNVEELASELKISVDQTSALINHPRSALGNGLTKERLLACVAADYSRLCCASPAIDPSLSTQVQCIAGKIVELILHAKPIH